jgi:hypothetical protein
MRRNDNEEDGKQQHEGRGKLKKKMKEGTQ